MLVYSSCNVAEHVTTQRAAPNESKVHKVSVVRHVLLDRVRMRYHIVTEALGYNVVVCLLFITKRLQNKHRDKSVN